MKLKFDKKETLKRKTERREKRVVIDAIEWNDPEYRLASFEEAQADLMRWAYVVIA